MTPEALSDAVFSDFQGVSDLNSELHIVQSGSFPAAGDSDVRWQNFVLPDHGFFAMENLSPDRSPTWRRSSCQDA